MNTPGMNTPAHIVFSLALLGPVRAARYAIAIAVGAMLPDLAMVGFYAWHKFLGTAEAQIWSLHYFDPAWQALFDLANSIPILLVALGVALWRRHPLLACVFASMLIHCAADLLLHHDDAHRHFYPLSDWRFQSPVSYWDPSHHGEIAARIEIAVVLGLAAWLWYANRNTGAAAKASRLRPVLGITLLTYGVYFYYVMVTWM